MLWRITLALAALAAAMSQIVAQQNPGGPTEPGTWPVATNVIMIVLDDVGTDKLSFYGETPPECPSCTACDRYPDTPNLERLLQSGLLFRNAYANPLCSPTRACLLTGRYAFRTGVGDVTTDDLPDPYDEHSIPNAEVFLPELLHDGYPPVVEMLGLPYTCGAFGKWHVAGESNSSNTSHVINNGFDVFRGTMKNVQAIPGATYFAYPLIESEGPSQAILNEWHGTATSRHARDWINAQPGAFFAYVCFNPPHTPWQVPPSDLLRKNTRDELIATLGTAGSYPDEEIVDTTASVNVRRLVYRAMIEAVDAEIGNLIDGIAPEKLANTMIFVIGDNGTPNAVLNTAIHTPYHGKGTPYEWGIRVPLIVSGPLITNPGETDALVHAVDLWPTIAEIAGASPTLAFDAAGLSTQHPIDGLSFLPVLTNPSHPGRSFVFCEYFTPNQLVGVLGQPFYCFKNHNRSVSDGVYKLIRRQNPEIPIVPSTAPTYMTPLFFKIGGNGSREETVQLSLTPSPGSAEEIALSRLNVEMDRIAEVYAALYDP